MQNKVLLVDDDLDVLESLCDRLELHGFDVQTCTSFIEAVDHISVHFEGVIVSDVCMPGKSGLDLVKRAQSIDPELPVIILTGFAQTQTVVTAMQGGAVTVLEKPCSIPILIGEIEKSIELRQTVLTSRARNAKDIVRQSAGRPPKDKALAPQMAEVERQLILRTMRRCKGNKTRAALELGISRSQLYEKLRKEDF